VFQTSSRLLIGFALAGVLAYAQGTPGAPAGKQFKDRPEYDLFEAIRTDTNPATKLQKLDQWKSQYPTTDYADDRMTSYLTTYAALNRAQDAVNTAKEMLAKDPKNATAQYYIMLLTRPLGANGASAELLDLGEKATNSMVANIATPLPPLTQEQWEKARPEVETLAHTTLGWIAMQRKNWQGAEDELKKSLAITPNSGEIDYMLATAIYSQKADKPAKLPAALFYFARAAAYDGTGALNPEGRKQVLAYLQKAYNNYHGSAEGLDQLLQTAKASATPPADLHIRTREEIAEELRKQQEEEARKNPQLALWKSIKEALTGADGANYFKSSMEGALLPELSGKVVSIDPAIKPKTVVIAIEGDAADATLKFETPLPGKVEPGAVLTFQASPVSYAVSPFMVVFNAEKANLKGWTGTGGATPAKKPAPRHTAKR
jgi:tetratricopeptide (TPR) repeat protein